MDEKHKKRGRRSHLNDFHLNVAGEYVYDGSVFVCRSSEESLRGSKRAVWIMAAALALAVVAGGCIPAPGMQNCFYVLLKLIVLLCALGVRAKIMQAEWDKIPKKDKS